MRPTLNRHKLNDLLGTPLNTNDHVIWVDPGESTGWAFWATDGTFLSGQDEAYHVETEVFWALMSHGRHVQLGWEQYLITGSRVKHDGSALRVIGFLEWATRHAGCRVLKPVPSSARNLGQDGDKLQALDWYVPGRRDANAAAAHLLAYLLRESLLPQHLLRRLVDGDSLG